MNEALTAIKQYILNPDRFGCHLRQMCEQMADADLADARVDHVYGLELRNLLLDRAADVLACYIHLVWDGAGPTEYAPRTLEILQRLQGRMRGMDADCTWDYALDAFNTDIVSRLERAGSLTIAPAQESEMLHHFFDRLEEYEYLHDLAQNIMHLHWQRRHCLDSPTVDRGGKTGVPVGPRGSPAVERHLKRAAIEGLATYIEQSNIARGNIEGPADPLIVLHDRIEIQLALGGKNAQTWAASGWQVADHIEARFGTAAGRREARRARGLWKAIARKHAAVRR